MKFLHVISSMDPAKGGSSQALRSIIPELEQLGVSNEVVSTDDPQSTFLGKDDFPIHALAGKGPWAYSEKLIPWMVENLQRFDRVIIHGLWLYSSHATNKAFQLYRKNVAASNEGKIAKLYVMPHGMLDPYFQKAEGRKLKAIRNWFYWKLIEGRVINQADGLLFTCETELELARTTFVPYRPKKEMSVGLGIEAPPAYVPSMKDDFYAKCREVEGQPYLLFLSRIHPKKGVELLIKAYQQIATTSPGARLPKLVIAGPGLETTYGKMVYDTVQNSSELRNLIVFPGMLSGNAKWGAFYLCNAFVLPSHQENFGIAVVEALACGKPVLISNQVNIWKEIEAAGAGIVDEVSAEGTRQVLTKWLNLTEGAKEAMSLKATAVYQKEFAISSAARRLLAETTG